MPSVPTPLGTINIGLPKPNTGWIAPVAVGLGVILVGGTIYVLVQGKGTYNVSGLTVVPRETNGSPWIVVKSVNTNTDITLDVKYTISRNAKPGLLSQWTTFVKVTDQGDGTVLYNQQEGSFGELDDATQDISVSVDIGQYATAGTVQLLVEVGGDGITRSSKTVNLTIVSTPPNSGGQDTYTVSVSQPDGGLLTGSVWIWPGDVQSPTDFNYGDTCYVKAVGTSVGPAYHYVKNWYYNGFKIPVHSGQYDVVTPSGNTVTITSHDLTTIIDTTDTAGLIQFTVVEDVQITQEFGLAL